MFFSLVPVHHVHVLRFALLFAAVFNFACGAMVTWRTYAGAIAKCAAGGRDHTSCCIRRGVTSTCLPYCRGILPETPVDCLALHGGSIIQCYDEGKYLWLFCFMIQFFFLSVCFHFPRLHLLKCMFPFTSIAWTFAHTVLWTRIHTNRICFEKFNTAFEL